MAEPLYYTQDELDYLDATEAYQKEQAAKAAQNNGFGGLFKGLGDFTSGLLSKKPAAKPAAKAKPVNYTPWIIGLGGLVLVMFLLIAFTGSRR